MRTSLEEEYDNRSVIKQITDLRKESGTATVEAQDAKRQAAEALGKANAAAIKADNAQATANGYQKQIDDANRKSTEALTTATGAADLVDGVAAQAQVAADKADAATLAAGEASAASQRAEQKATLATQTAQAVEDKADKAIVDASSALVRANSAVSKVDNVTGAVAEAQATADAADAKTVTNKNAIQATNTRVGVLEVEAGQTAADMGLTVRAVELTANATDGKITSTRKNGSTSERAVPIASETQAGIVNAQTMTNLRRMNERIRGLEEGYNIKYGTIAAGSGATQSEIKAAYLAAGGTEPVPVGARIVDLQKSVTFVWDGAKWIRPDATTVPIFGQATAGLIKGGDPKNAGSVIAELDGTGSVQGWSALQAQVNNQADEIVTIDGMVAAIDARVSVAEGDITANAGKIAEVDTKATDNAGAISALDATVGNSSSGLVKQIADAEIAIGEAAGAASTAGIKADNAKTAADKAVVSLVKSADPTKMILTAGKGNGEEFTVNLDAATDEKAGAMTADLHKHVLKDNAASTVTSRITFALNPFVEDVKEGELTSQRVAPVKQIHQAFVNVDNQIKGITPDVSIVPGSGEGVNAIQVKIGDNSSQADLPKSGGPTITQYHSSRNPEAITDFFNAIAGLKTGSVVLIDSISTSDNNIRFLYATAYRYLSTYTLQGGGNLYIDGQSHIITHINCSPGSRYIRPVYINAITPDGVATLDLVEFNASNTTDIAAFIITY